MPHDEEWFRRFRAEHLGEASEAELQACRFTHRRARVVTALGFNFLNLAILIQQLLVGSTWGILFFGIFQLFCLWWLAVFASPRTIYDYGRCLTLREKLEWRRRRRDAVKRMAEMAERRRAAKERRAGETRAEAKNAEEGRGRDRDRVRDQEERESPPHSDASASPAEDSLEAHCSVLGIDPKSIRPELVEEAYRKAAISNHPDKRPDDPFAARRFRAIQEAYEALRGK